MKCPLFMIHILQEAGKVDLAKVDCLKEECAVWDHRLKVCSVKVIRESLVAISQSLASINNKMPQQVQP